MSTKTILKFLLFMNIFLQVLSGDKIEYKPSTIDNMKKSIFKSKSEKIYYVGNLIESNIIAFSDLNNDKYTDIIVYNDTDTVNEKIFNFYVHYYDKKDKKFGKEVYLFNITINKTDEANCNNITVRNLHVFSFYYDKKSDKEYSFLITLEKPPENEINKNGNNLLHYVTSKSDDFSPYKLDIYSNILILNKDSNKNVRFVYYDKKRKICLLKRDKSEQKYYCEEYEKDIFDKGLNNGISLKGGVGYVDLNGDCIPDIVLSYEDDDSIRHIDIYVALSEKNYTLRSTIDLGNDSDFGAFTIARVNDDKDPKNAPFLEILVPKLNDKIIYHFTNKSPQTYKWSTYYCKNDKTEGYNGEDLFKKDNNYTSELKIDGQGIKFNANFPTVIRTGDFLGTSNPGIIVQHETNDDNGIEAQISLFERKDKNYIYYDGIKMDGIKKYNDFVEKDEKLEKGLFFDIDESGTLSFIATSNKGRNYFFFNYKRNIYFIKSKLMNDKDKYYDSNLGACYRYIVTDKKGNRHMDISYQLIQTSDMNIPLPYSIMGLDDTNNYVEYFQTISGNILNDVTWAKKDEDNYKGNSPVIPNTQMMISKYYSGTNKIEWNVDLIVQPMEKIWLFLIIVILVLLIVLGIIIYLHLKELKEEQKETNKFKSWFA